MLEKGGLEELKQMEVISLGITEAREKIMYTRNWTEQQLTSNGSITFRNPKYIFFQILNQIIDLCL